MADALPVAATKPAEPAPSAPQAAAQAEPPKPPSRKTTPSSALAANGEVPEWPTICAW
jgi:hypothetical protein